MQTLAERKRLILEGRYTELEPPQHLGFGLKTGFPDSPQQIPHAVRQVFSTEREPGEDG